MGLHNFGDFVEGTLRISGVVQAGKEVIIERLYRTVVTLGDVDKRLGIV